MCYSIKGRVSNTLYPSKLPLVSFANSMPIKNMDSVGESLKSTPKIYNRKRTGPEGKPYGISKEINEIINEMSDIDNWICFRFGNMVKAEKETAKAEQRITELQPQHDECKSTLKARATEYLKLKADNANLDRAKLAEARKRLRPVKDK